MDIGGNIKKYRKLNKLTQKELAKNIGVTDITIQNYENNRREPKIETLDKIASILGVTIDDLFSFRLNQLNLSQIPTDVLIEELNNRNNFPIKIARK